ncbi:MAG: protoporphyrinogen oxidase [Cyclobacteriaceae bacterium]|nr:protoporphyrinogen oxidase [Cyclobacteriaceae bacterium]
MSLAWFLKEKNIPFKIIESESKAGGCIETVQSGNYLMEMGPNSLLLNEEQIDMLSKFGLKESLIKAEEVNKNRFIFKKGQYRKLPGSPPALLLNNFFSWKTKWAILREYRKKSKAASENESVADFFRRRFNNELVDYAVDPFVSGIYAGEPEQLLMRLTFSALAEAEKKHGSLIKGMIKEKKSTGRKSTYSFQKGLSELIHKLSEQIEIERDTRVLNIKKDQNGLILETSKGEIKAEKCIITIPSFSCADILQNGWPNTSEILRKVYYPPLCCVHNVYKRDKVQHPLDGFGGLNPRKEKQFASGSIWSSSIFPNRCDSDEVLITTFVGGSNAENKTKLSDKEILQEVHHELSKVYQISDKPVFQHLKRWNKAIPQYDEALAKVLAVIESLELDEIYICANWKGGVSVTDCISKAKKLADRLECNC